MWSHVATADAGAEAAAKVERRVQCPCTLGSVGYRYKYYAHKLLRGQSVQAIVGDDNREVTKIVFAVAVGK